MIDKLSPKIIENFKNTGKLPVIFCILTSGNKDKIQKLINVYSEFKMIIKDTLDNFK